MPWIALERNYLRLLVFSDFVRAMFGAEILSFESHGPFCDQNFDISSVAFFYQLGVTLLNKYCRCGVTWCNRISTGYNQAFASWRISGEKVAE